METQTYIIFQVYEKFILEFVSGAESKHVHPFAIIRGLSHDLPMDHVVK